MNSSNELVYDIGLHDGNDTRYYLAKGYSVVAVDANPLFVKRAEEELKEYLENGKLVLLNIAISDTEGPVSFSISSDDHFSSIDSELAARGGDVQQIRVEAKKVSSLFAAYGIPYYCKIDIEGYDSFCLKTIDKEKGIPKYISAEALAERAGKQISEREKLEVLDLLYGLGYTKFKLVDQHSLRVLQPGEKFYTLSLSPWARSMRHLQRKLGIDKQLAYRKTLQQQLGYTFVNGASGPFGKDLGGAWYDYETAKRTLLQHMDDHYSRPGVKPFSFWCDWHATTD